MNKDQRRRRRIGVATLLGLTAMLVGLMVAPSVGQAAGTGTAVAESTWQEVLTVDNPAPTLTLRDFQRMAERAAGTSIRPSDLSVLVDAGKEYPGTLLVSLVDGPGLDTTFDELTGGRRSAEEVKVIIIIKCDKCNVG